MMDLSLAVTIDVSGFLSVGVSGVPALCLPETETVSEPSGPGAIWLSVDDISVVHLILAGPSFGIFSWMEKTRDGRFRIEAV